MTGIYPTSTHRKLYRSRDGMIFGICKGFADYAEVSVFWVRLIMVVLFVFTGFFPIVLLYLLAPFLMKPEPVMAPPTADDWEFYNSMAADRSMGVARLKRKFEQLERRTRRMESAVTAREFDWEERLRTGE